MIDALGMSHLPNIMHICHSGSHIFWFQMHLDTSQRVRKGTRPIPWQVFANWPLLQFTSLTFRGQDWEPVQEAVVPHDVSWTSGNPRIRAIITVRNYRTWWNRRTFVMNDNVSPALHVMPPGTGRTHFHSSSGVLICNAATVWENKRVSESFVPFKLKMLFK